jgi:hypothetical protein
MAQKNVIKLDLSEVKDLDKLESLTDSLFARIENLDKSWSEGVDEWNQSIVALLQEKANVEQDKKVADTLAKNLESSFKSIGMEITKEISDKINYINKVYPEILKTVQRHRQEIREQLVARSKLIK